MTQHPSLLSLHNLRVSIDGKSILNLPDLQIAAGEHVAILGGNGSGKSTLVKLISRQAYPSYGSDIRIMGADSWNVAQLRQLLGIVSGSMQLEFEGEPPIEVLDCVVSSFFASRGLWAHHDYNGEMVQASEAALAQVGASHLIGRTMESLSTGEARRVLIARALVHRPKALLLDEPCAGLDPAARHHFLTMLRSVAAAGTSLVLITHHIEEILPEMQRIVMLRGGELFADGAKDQMLTGKNLSALFGLPMVVAEQGGWYRADVLMSDTAS
jgi:iron complex transport system ATP-binding protein